MTKSRTLGPDPGIALLLQQMRTTNRRLFVLALYFQRQKQRCKNLQQVVEKLRQGRYPAVRVSRRCSHMLEYAALAASPHALSGELILVFQPPAKGFESKIFFKPAVKHVLFHVM
jgi:hypothetical protein